MSQSTATKTCCTCGIEKPVTEFHRLARASDGRQSKCRPCCAEYQRAYNALHGEARAERRTEQARLNAERDREAKRKWDAANPENRLERKHRRRAREKNARIGVVDLTALWTGSCGICGDEIDPSLAPQDPMSKSVDHIIPLAKGGAHAQGNLQWAHRICNLRKGAKLVA